MYVKTPRDVSGKFRAAKALLEQAQKSPNVVKPVLIGAAAGAALVGVVAVAADKIRG